METAYGIRKTKLGWQVVIYRIENGKVVKEEKSEPDFRSLALERFSREVAAVWGDQD
jgi:hypothetical protein